MQKLYRRRQDGKFPIYHPEATRGGTFTVSDDNGNENKIPYVYDMVVDNSDYTIDFETHMHGDWGEPYNKGGQWYVERKIVKRDVEKVNAAYWEAVRADRDAELARTDVLVIRALEEQLQGHDDLKEHRRKLRNITDPKLNGGKKDPKAIKVKKF